jgi:hypothetical protein
MVSGFSSVKHLSNFTLTQFSQATGLTLTEVAEQCGFSTTPSTSQGARTSQRFWM